jgi:preprotein translocase subunit SecG
MNITTILILVNVFTAVAIIALVLMQQSKGDMGSAFGGGGSSSMFGSKGSANFLTRCTSTMVTLFFVSSLTLAYIYAKRNASEQEIAPITVEQSSEVPTIDSVIDEQSSDIPTIDADEAVIEGEIPVVP